MGRLGFQKKKKIWFVGRKIIHILLLNIFPKLFNKFIVMGILFESFYWHKEILNVKIIKIQLIHLSNFLHILSFFIRVCLHLSEDNHHHPCNKQLYTVSYVPGPLYYCWNRSKERSRHTSSHNLLFGTIDYDFVLFNSTAFFLVWPIFCQLTSVF